MHSPKQIRRVMGTPNLSGAVLLGAGNEVNKQRVRNVTTGRVLPCCWADCMVNGDNRYRITVPHDQPERRDSGDTLTYIFCSEQHKTYYLWGIPKS